jgi:uncharacterized protein
MNWTDPALGFVVGVLLGTTGTGGGAVMTPLLVLVRGTQPIVAVGTDLVWALVTKLFGAFFYSRSGAVDYALVRPLAWGSLPGCLLGIAVLHAARGRLREAELNAFLLRAVGLALILVAASLLARMVLKPRGWRRGWKPLRPKTRAALTVATGAVVGLLVALTSVGSGSLVLAVLLVAYAGASLRRIIGVDMLHSVLLGAVAALGQWGMGSVNERLLAGLLLGSIPGIWLGARLGLAIPEKVLRPLLASLLFAVGYKFL